MGNPYVHAGTVSHYWNIKAFQDVPASTTTGVQRQGYNAGYDNLRGPSFWVSNLSVFKEFPLKDEVKLQLRFEFFNAFNHVNLGMPNTNIDTPDTFGLVTYTTQYQQDQNAQRSGQVALKVEW